jgi:predicted KAP-like P-loop ATPase
MGRVIWQLLKRLDETYRFDLLKESISDGRSISTIVHEITVEGQGHGKYGVDKPYPEEERTVNAEHLKELENVALERVRNAAQDNSLLQTPHLSSVLYRWSDWASGDEVKQWIDKVIKDDNNLVALLEKFLQKTSSQSMDDRVLRFEYRLNPKWLEPFTDINHVFDRVNELVQNDNLTDRQKIAIKSFIREYNMIQQGLNPDSPFDRKTLDTNRSISNN